MAKLKLRGMDEYEDQLLGLANITTEVIGRAIYSGAKEIADQCRANIEALPIDTRVIRRDGDTRHGVTPKEKEGLLDGFGIARLIDDNGFKHVKLGFDGYNYNGTPNVIIARSLNSGSSFHDKIPFVDNAVSAKKTACEEAMKKTFDEELRKVVK